MNNAQQIKKLLKDKRKDISNTKPQPPIEPPDVKEVPIIPPTETVNKAEEKESTLGNNPVHKQDIFISFIMYNSIPEALKAIFREDPKKLKEYGYDIDDPILKRLLRIKNQTQFCEDFKIDRSTASEWKQREDYQKLLSDILIKNMQAWKSDVDFAFMQKLVECGDAARYKLYNQIFHNFQEGLKHELTGRDGGPIKIEDAREKLISALDSMSSEEEAGKDNIGADE